MEKRDDKNAHCLSNNKDFLENTHPYLTEDAVRCSEAGPGLPAPHTRGLANLGPAHITVLVTPVLAILNDRGSRCHLDHLCYLVTIADLGRCETSCV